MPCTHAMLTPSLLPSQGYGFLSENARFVEICTDHGLEFIGPKPMHIRQMGDKSTAKDTMKVRMRHPAVPPCAARKGRCFTGCIAVR